MRVCVCVCSSVRQYAIRYDTIRYDTIRYDTTRHDTTRHGTARHGTVRYGTVRYGTVRYGTVRYGSSPRWLGSCPRWLDCWRLAPDACALLVPASYYYYDGPKRPNCKTLVCRGGGEGAPCSTRRSRTTPLAPLSACARTHAGAALAALIWSTEIVRLILGTLHGPKT